MSASDSGLPSTSPLNASSDVNITGGEIHARDIVGGDKIIHGDEVQTKIVVTAEEAYDVRGLANPYLGLAAFTYADRAKYAGRGKLITETVARMTTPGAAIPLLFITGASGSGKSSFAQAGLLPALEKFYEGFTIKRAVMRPGADPLAALNDALWRQLHLALTPGVSADATGLKPEGIFRETPPNQINLLVLDQFEEFFTQAPQTAHETFFAFLTDLAPFAQTRTHIIATLRADYLPELFNYSALYEIAKRGVDLRAMNEQELQSAIQQPLRAQYPDGTKRFEPELVEQLAHDAAQEASYLPLMQVTLEEIWRKGFLTRSAFTNLADALEERANQVLQYRDYDAAQPLQLRTPDEQNTLLDILLNLVDVSLDDDARRDVRKQRTKQELAHGDATRTQMIDALTSARLLSVEVDARDPNTIDVDLIHESLLQNWERLHAAIQARRRNLRERAHFEQNLDEWLTQNRADDYLLDGVRLAEARELETRDDIALQSNDAKSFLRASNAKAEAEQQHELERERQRADALKQRARILRFAVIGVSGLLVIALIAVWFAWQQSRSSDARRIAVQASALRDTNLDLAMVLAAHARQLDSNAQVMQVYLDFLTRPIYLAGHLHGALTDRRVKSVRLSPDGRWLVTTGNDGIALWDMRARRFVGKPFEGMPHDVDYAEFSPDGKTLAAVSYGKVKFWDTTTHQSTHEIPSGQTRGINSLAFSPDWKTLAVGTDEGQILLLNVETAQPAAKPLPMQFTAEANRSAVQDVQFSPDGKSLAAIYWDGLALWDLNTRQAVNEHIANANAPIAYSPDGQWLALNSGSGVMFKHLSTRETFTTTLEANTFVFSPDSQTLALANQKKAMLVNVSTREPVADLGETSHEISSLAYSPDGALLVGGGYDQGRRQDGTDFNILTVWNTTKQRPVGQTLSAHAAAVTSAAFRADGDFFMTASEDGTAQLWNTLTRAPYGAPFRGPTSKFLSGATLSADGKWVAISGCSKPAEPDKCAEYEIVIWDAAAHQIVEQLGPFDRAMNAVTFSPDNTLLAASRYQDPDYQVTLWDTSTWQPSGEPLKADGAWVMAFSPDSTLLAAASDRRNVTVLNVKTRERLAYEFQVDQGFSARALAFSPDSKRIAVGGLCEMGSCADKQIYVWDVATGQQLGQPITQAESVHGLAFHPNGKILAAAGCGPSENSRCDGVIAMWNLDTRQRIGQTIPGQVEAVSAIAYSPDGDVLIAGSEDHNVTIWDASPDAWRDPACFIAGRNLTRQEWDEYFNPVPKEWNPFVGPMAGAYDSLYRFTPTCPNLPTDP